ncbi:excinuclease [Shewanella salipaludis]|uniref:Excinuclease n=1 Tax=Shewanella salipaludis TaxID=2723052 RepID=A0A972G129_9GAMM|nr:excinuclease [Shewanella salipaludis]NMH66883.1 excinuclease [Shewanella salipaludis]
MKKYAALLASSLVMLSSSCYARNDISDYSIQDALSVEQAKIKLGDEVAFYFGDQKYGETVQDFGEFKTNKKTNAFNKSDLEACQWVFLSAMITLKERALKEGANAVVDIKSNYKGNLTSSNDTFQCGAGTFVSGVALTGKMVKLK